MVVTIWPVALVPDSAVLRYRRRMELWAVVVAAGSGSRFGRLKQLELLGGRRVIDWSVNAMRRVSRGVVIVGPPVLDDVETLDGLVRVDGGASRSDSVRNGLAAVPASATHVLVHDAARPLVAETVVDAVVSALVDGAEAVVPVVAVTDTLRSVESRAVDRDRFVAVQTPQGFRLDTLREAHEAGLVASDDATLIEGLGRPVVHVEGDPTNMKITFAHDIFVAERLMEDR